MKTTATVTALMLFIAFRSFATPPEDKEKGKDIFSTRCVGCHNVNKVLTGPALSGVDGRHTIDWIINFVHSSQTVIKSGDKEAVDLYEKFNRIPMPDHPDLTASDIKNIVAYIKSASVSSEGESAPFRKPGKLHASYTPLSTHSYAFFISYLLTVLLLASGLLTLVKVKEMQRKNCANPEHRSDFQ